ncbi:MFS transporter [Streptomyces sp. SID13031]|uniref:MFS transporter n=1 Tax=Streptomyces sp. SID13031 TaxID=2706046 RepID=UPI0013CA7E39|nr:MFS transporter [Streptomyces sp. SID13031]NEA34622.1 MFS transporter [Streptomyces sp. SID13031]
MSSSLPPEVRRLVAATLVNTFGNGVYAAVGALYLTRMAGLSVGHVGIGLTIAGLAGLIVSTPLGVVADRLGPNRAYIAFLLLQAVMMATLTQVRSFPLYVGVAALTAIADSGQRGAKGALIAGLVPSDQRVRTLAMLRVTTNIGMGVGMGLAGIVLAVDRREVYIVALLANAATYLITAGLVRWGMPRLAPVPSATGPSGFTALKDRAFLIFVGLDGLLSMHNAMAQIAIPLWVATATDAPTWLISVLLVTNSVAVILLQVRVARGTEHLAGAARAGRRAGLLLALACGVLAVTDVTSGAVTIVLLLVAAVVHVLGEMLQSAGGWGISFGLAPAGAQGQYQGAYAMGHQFGDLIAPFVLTVVAVSWGWPGWLLTATIFLLAGAFIPVVVGRRSSDRDGLQEVAELAGGCEARPVAADRAG